MSYHHARVANFSEFKKNWEWNKDVNKYYIFYIWHVTVDIQEWCLYLNFGLTRFTVFGFNTAICFIFNKSDIF